MDEEIATLTKFFDTLVEFSVTYGFQILGALVFLFVGLKIASWAGRKATRLAGGKDVDPTLAKFMATSPASSSLPCSWLSRLEISASRPLRSSHLPGPPPLV